LNTLKIFVVSLVVAVPLAAQDLPPADMAAGELARSRACVAPLTGMARLDVALAPLAVRAERIRALNQAMVLEDSSAVVPFDADDSADRMVQEWFASDGVLALRYVEARDDAINDQRRVEREAVRDRLREELQAVGARGQEMIAQASETTAGGQDCEGAILVRPVVLEVCAAQGLTGPVCDGAAAPEGNGPGEYVFVGSADELWDVEEFRPWSNPMPLSVTPEGGLGGGRTMARARRGNVVALVGLGSLIRPRSEMSAEEITEFDANLDSLGFTFDHPGFVMAPAIDLQIGILGRLGGETHYLLHFGDLSAPAEQVVWEGPAVDRGPIQALFPAPPGALVRLAAGEALSLTAVKVTEGAEEAEAVFTLSFTPVNQARAASSLLGYMAGGQLGRDLAALVPPTEGVGG